MFPVGTYDHFLDILEERKGKTKAKYFVVLFCPIDFRRDIDSELLILTNLDQFNIDSSGLVDYYIPGYIKGSKINRRKYNKNQCIIYDNEEYFFVKGDFDVFFNKFRENFFEDLKYPLQPKIVFVEYSEKKTSDLSKLDLRLDTMKCGLRDAGNLFFEMFSFIDSVEKESTLEELSNFLKRNGINVTDILSESLENPKKFLKICKSVKNSVDSLTPK